MQVKRNFLDADLNGVVACWLSTACSWL